MALIGDEVSKSINRSALFHYLSNPSLSRRVLAQRSLASLGIPLDVLDTETGFETYFNHHSDQYQELIEQTTEQELGQMSSLQPIDASNGVVAERISARIALDGR